MTNSTQSNSTQSSSAQSSSAQVSEPTPSAASADAADGRQLHVLIVGGGLGGLALAQGLVAAGHSVDVFERDADARRRQGYYLTMNGDGGEALRRLLPPDLFELYLDTSRLPYPTQASVVRDARDLRRLGARPSIGPENLGERRHTGVDRRTLRGILGARIQQHVHWGVSAERYEEDADGVTLFLSDGRSVRGDLLVAADGIRSAVRDQKLPATYVVPAAIQGIDLYARAPYTDELLAVIPEELHDSMLIVTDKGPNRCLLGSFRPRVPIGAAGSAAGVELDDVQPYMMVSCSVLPDTVIPPAGEWTAETRAEIKASMQAVVANWHPAVQAIVAQIDLDSIFSIAFSYLDPVADWPSSRVTVLGDAAHGMLPTLGMGANSAMRDAAVLADRIGDIASGRASIESAIGEYEAEMRAFAYPLISIAADHDNVFGGGALSPTGAPAAAAH